MRLYYGNTDNAKSDDETTVYGDVDNEFLCDCTEDANYYANINNQASAIGDFPTPTPPPPQLGPVGHLNFSGTIYGSIAAPQVVISSFEFKCKFTYDAGGLNAEPTIASDGTNTFRIYIERSSGDIFVYIDGILGLQVASASWDDGRTWHDLIVRRSGASGTIAGYINGVFYSGNNTSNANVGPTVIGAHDLTASTYYEGKIAYVAFGAQNAYPVNAWSLREYDSATQPNYGSTATSGDITINNAVTGDWDLFNTTEGTLTFNGSAFGRMVYGVTLSDCLVELNFTWSTGVTRSQLIDGTQFTLGIDDASGDGTGSIGGLSLPSIPNASWDDGRPLNSASGSRSSNLASMSYNESSAGPTSVGTSSIFLHTIAARGAAIYDHPSQWFLNGILSDIKIYNGSGVLLHHWPISSAQDTFQPDVVGGNDIMLFNVNPGDWS